MEMEAIVMNSCSIVFVGKRRDGKPKHWCIAHKSTATGKYGVKLEACIAAADPVISPQETLHLSSGDFAGGVALWGAVPAVYDTTDHIVDRGIHVHARHAVGGRKHIDRTYRRVIVENDDAFEGVDRRISIDELDAIYYMASTVLGYEMRTVICPRCNHVHLDKDWFSVHYHQKHLCSGCGREFKDSSVGIGNPLILLKEKLGDRAQNRPLTRPDRELDIKQADYPHGIQIWGSNPAIVWTSPSMEEEGIHVHCYGADRLMPDVDDTYSKVTIDGVELDPRQVRTFMAQMALPHSRDRVISLSCPSCGTPHFDTAERAFTPHDPHECENCGASFRVATQSKKTISNPFVAVRQALAQTASRSLQEATLDLRPETI